MRKIRRGPVVSRLSAKLASCKIQLIHHHSIDFLLIRDSSGMSSSVDSECCTVLWGIGGAVHRKEQ
jgi:hypothetical protein